MPRKFSRSDPHQPLPKLPEPTPKETPSQRRARDSGARRKLTHETQNKQREWQARQKKLIQGASKRREFEINTALEKESLPEDMKNPSFYTSRPKSIIPDQEEEALIQLQRRKMIEKYSSIDAKGTGWDKMDERNRQNVQERLEQAKRIQFQAETGIPLPDKPGENEIALKIWEQRNHSKQKQITEDYFAAARERAIHNAEIERLEIVANNRRALVNPDNIDQIQEEIAVQKRRQFEKYMAEKDKDARDQDQFMTRFRRKQDIRQNMLKGMYGEEKMRELVDQDDRDLALKPDTTSSDLIVRPDDAKYNQYLLDRSHLALEGRDLDAELKNESSGRMTYGQLKSIVDDKQPISTRDVRSVFKNTYAAIEANRLTALQTASERENRLETLRKELGLVPLAPNAKEELKDEAVKRVNTGLLQRKKQLSKRLAETHRAQLKAHTRRKPDGREDLAARDDDDDPDYREGSVLQQLKPGYNRLHLRPHKQQLYAPLIIDPPKKLNLEELDPTKFHDHEVHFDGEKYTAKDQVSILQKHLGMQQKDRSHQQVLRRAKHTKRFPVSKVHHHLKAKLKVPGPKVFVKHPNTGKMVRRSSLSYMHRVKSDIIEEFEIKHAALEKMTDEERHMHNIAKLKDVSELDVKHRHELQVKQIFGPKLLDTGPDDEAGLRMERMIRNMHAESIIAINNMPEPGPNQHQIMDPSDFTVDQLRDDLKLPAPQFNKHVHPETKQRGIHLLMHDSDVHIPKPTFPEQIKFKDGMSLKVSGSMFNQKFDAKLDKTRNNYSLQAHERPTHENEGEAYLLDSDGNDISHLNQSVDPADVDNLTKFHDAYGKTPMNYVNKVYHDVLGNTLLQQSRQFMLNTHDIPYQRPFSNILTSFGFTSNNKVNELDQLHATPTDNNNKLQLQYNYDYSDPNFRNVRPDSTVSVAPSPPVVPSRKNQSFLTRALAPFNYDAKSAVFDPILNTIRFITTGDSSYDFRSTGSNDNDGLFGSNARFNSLQKGVIDLFNTPRANKPPPSKGGSPIPYYLKVNQSHPGAKFFTPSEAPNHLIEAARSQTEPLEQFASRHLGAQTKIDRTFSDFLPTLLKERYSTHDLHSLKIEEYQRKAAERQLERYTNPTLVLQQFVVSPVVNTISRLYSTSSNAVGSIITRNANNVTIPTYPMGDYTQKNPRQSVPTANNNNNSNPKSMRDGPQFSSIVNIPPSLQNHVHSKAQQDQYERLSFDINQVRTALNRGGPAQPPLLPEVFRHLNPSTVPTRQEHMHLRELQRDLNNGNNNNNSDRTRPLELDNNNNNTKPTMSQSPPPPPPQLTTLNPTKVSLLQSRLDSLLPPVHVETKHTKDSWIKAKMESLPLQQQFTNYMDQHFPALINRTTAALFSPQRSFLFRPTLPSLAPTLPDHLITGSRQQQQQRQQRQGEFVPDFHRLMADEKARKLNNIHYSNTYNQQRRPEATTNAIVARSNEGNRGR